MMVKNLISIDFGSSKTAAVYGDQDEFVFGSKGLVVNKQIDLSLLGLFLKKTMDSFYRSDNIKKSSVVLSLPNKIIGFHKQNNNEKKIKIKKILENVKKYNNSKGDFYYLSPLYNEYDSRDVWFPFVRREVIEKVISVLKAYKSELLDVFYGPALFDGYTDVDDFLLIDLGGLSTEMIFYKGQKIVDIHKLDLGGEHVLADIIAVLKMDPDQARTKFFNFTNLFDSFLLKNKADIMTKVVDARIKELFNLIKTNVRSGVKQIYLFGGLANLPRLCDYLQQYLNIKVVNLNEKESNFSFLSHQAHLMREKFLEG